KGYKQPKATRREPSHSSTANYSILANTNPFGKHQSATNPSNHHQSANHPLSVRCPEPFTGATRPPPAPIHHHQSTPPTIYPETQSSNHLQSPIQIAIRDHHFQNAVTDEIERTKEKARWKGGGDCEGERRGAARKGRKADSTRERKGVRGWRGEGKAATWGAGGWECLSRERQRREGRAEEKAASSGAGRKAWLGISQCIGGK
ncbi:hypothetical protein Drorol1_Dr00004149, partial [Drosera rotundifolia]